MNKNGVLKFVYICFSILWFQNIYEVISIIKDSDFWLLILCLCFCYTTRIMESCCGTSVSRRLIQKIVLRSTTNHFVIRFWSSFQNSTLFFVVWNFDKTVSINMMSDEISVCLNVIQHISDLDSVKHITFSTLFLIFP